MHHANNDALTLHLTKYLESSPEYRQASEIVLANSGDGRVWLIGGFVFRTLAHLLHGTPRPAIDLDFIVETPRTDLVLPKGWTWRPNSFGNPKLIGPDLTIDFVPLNNVYSIVERGLEPTIENFQSGAPLDIQSVVFEIKSQQLAGDKGLAAITNRTVAPNSPEAAWLYEQKYHRPIINLATEKARGLSFQIQDSQYLLS